MPEEALNHRKCNFFKGSLVKGFSRVQQAVALSSCESELSALADACQESLGVNKISKHLFLGIDNDMRAIHDSFFGCNPVFHLASFLFAAKAQADSTVSQRVEQPDAIIEMYCDSQAAIRILQASGLQRRSRHVELRVYFCQELVKQGKIRLNWIDAGGQIADALTKTLGAKLFHRFVVLMGYLERSELSTEAYAHELILRSQIRTSPAKSKSMKSRQAAYSDLLPSSHSGVPANELKVTPNDNSASSVPDMLPGSPSSVSEPEAIRSC